MTDLREQLKRPEIPTIVSSLARSHGREYITPEDIGDALKSGADETLVRLEVLAHLGNQTSFGCEDSGCCAFVAYGGRAHVVD